MTVDTTCIWCCQNLPGKQKLLVAKGEQDLAVLDIKGVPIHLEPAPKVSTETNKIGLYWV